MTIIKDLTGKRFSRLTVIGRSPRRFPDGTGVWWICKCDCGNESEVSTAHLNTGHTKSCGCYNRELIGKSRRTHGQSKTRENAIWCSIKQRCYNKNDAGYKNYGGRGIEMCSEWKDSFENFFTDMGLCPEGMSIDRIDVNKGYSKDNCQWSTRAEQNNNRRNNIIIEHNGLSYTLGEWATVLGFHYCTLKTRYYQGDRGDHLFRSLDHEFVANKYSRRQSEVS